VRAIAQQLKIPYRKVNRYRLCFKPNSKGAWVRWSESGSQLGIQLIRMGWPEKIAGPHFIWRLMGYWAPLDHKAYDGWVEVERR
jgi:hypothetical protein